MADRDSMNDDLAERTESSYSSRESGTKYPDVFKKELGIRAWYAQKGEHEVDILPYQAGPNDPATPKGKWTHMFDMWVHRNVGPRDLQFLCLEKMYSEPCPICKYRNELRKNVPEGARQEKQHEDKLQQLNSSRQTLYNVLVYDSDEEEDKGVQVWQVAHYFFERHIAARAKIPKSHGGGYLSFSHSSKEQGRSITFTRSGAERNTKYEAHEFHKRKYSIADEDLDDCFTLDELVHIPTYDEVKEAFWDDTGAETEGEEETTTGTRARRRGRAEVEEEEPEEPVRRGGGVAVEPEPEEPVRSRRRAAVEPAPEEPAPRRRAQAQEAPEEPVRPRRRVQTEDEEAGERESVRQRGRGTEEEETGQSKRPQRVGKTGQTCPVAGGTFGVDSDDYDECETCGLWDPCVAAKSKKNKHGR